MAKVPEMLSGLYIPDFVPYVFGILALLLLWKLHEILVRAGRIQAVDFWDRSGIRMFIHATPNDAIACSACRGANGKVFLPSMVAHKRFKPIQGLCTNPSGCRCQLIGLYGGWSEAQALLGRLRQTPGGLQISAEEMERLLKGQWEEGPGASADRVSVRLLQAQQEELSNPEGAVEGYRFVMANAEEEREFPFLIPSYFRLSDLLERLGRPNEALPVVERFLKRYDQNSEYAATDSQLAMMSARRTRLRALLQKTEQAVNT